MAAARKLPFSRDDDGTPELVDVPAAIICAHCGNADCAGCTPTKKLSDTSSGIVVFVPWERPTQGFWSRFWSTTRASTEGAESFFWGLPDGAIAHALTFALAAEALAVGSTVLVCVGGMLLTLYLLLPGYTAQLLSNTQSLSSIVRLAGVSWVAFTSVLIAAHGVHGVMLNHEAKRTGSAPKLSQALRFGFYAAGWDVATSPIGAIHALFTAGPRSIPKIFQHATLTPGRATNALLRGTYNLNETSTTLVRRRAMAWTIVVSVVLIMAAMTALASVAIR
jgi:hypothetical protein